MKFMTALLATPQKNQLSRRRPPGPFLEILEDRTLLASAAQSNLVDLVSWRPSTAPTASASQNATQPITLPVDYASLYSGSTPAQNPSGYPPRTSAPPVIPTTLQWDTAQGGGDFSYQVTVPSVSRNTSVAVYWSASTQFTDRIGNAVSSQNVAAGTPMGTYGPINVAAATLGAPPAGAADLLLVTDPNNVFGDFSQSTNVLALQSRPDIVMNGSTDMATTPDTKTIHVTYDINGANINDQALEFDVYRSATSTSKDEFWGSATLAATDTADLTMGHHSQVALTLTDAGGHPTGDMQPDPAHRFVVVAANPHGTIIESDGNNDTNNVAYFQKHLLGVVAHGYTMSVSGATPQWETDLANTLLSVDGYEAVIPFNWVFASEARAPGEAIAAGNNLYTQVVTEAGGLVQQHPGDVIDIQFIGHSRGTVVISQTLQDIANEGNPIFTGGFLQMTMLDPHPANNAFGKFYSHNPVDSAVLQSYIFFQSGAQDPQVIVPNNVNEAEVFYQHTGYSRFLISDPSEFILNLWGEQPSLLINQSGSPINTKILTNFNDPQFGFVGHGEIHDWYQKYVADQQKTFTYFNPPLAGGSVGAEVMSQIGQVPGSISWIPIPMVQAAGNDSGRLDGGPIRVALEGIRGKESPGWRKPTEGSHGNLPRKEPYSSGPALPLELDLED
jgi:hypothetical protein